MLITVNKIYKCTLFQVCDIPAIVLYEKFNQRKDIHKKLFFKGGNQ